MSENRFKEIENRYFDLKNQMAGGKINAESYKQELKKLMLQDDRGRYWMIGGKSGNWYVYDNNEWKSADPYEAEEKKEAAVVEEREQPVEVGETRKVEEPVITQEPLTRDKQEDIPCKFCASKIPVHAQFCPFCGGNQKKITEEKIHKLAEGVMEIRSMRIFSLIKFLGCVGMVMGAVLGAIFGVIRIGGSVGEWLFHFPQILQDTQGNISGGFIFGAMGGFAGFIAFSVLGMVLSLFYNVISWFVGGIHIKVKT